MDQGDVGEDRRAIGSYGVRVYVALYASCFFHDVQCLWVSLVMTYLSVRIQTCSRLWLHKWPHSRIYIDRGPI